MIGRLAWWLTVIGSLSWGIIGALGIDLVARVLGAGTLATKIVYIVFGVAAVLMLVGAVKPKK